MSISFPGGENPVATVERLRALADDLERLTMFTPSAEALSEAPELRRWIHWRRSVPALVGRVHGHPIVGDRAAVTSEVFAIDEAAGWVRTFSRFYVLGRSADAGGSR